MEKLCAAIKRAASPQTFVNFRGSVRQCLESLNGAGLNPQGGQLDAWVKLITNPLLWWHSSPDKMDRGVFFKNMDVVAVSSHLYNISWMEEQCSKASEGKEETCQGLGIPSLQDSYVKCVAPRRNRYRGGNSSGSSGNIGVMTKLREEGWFEEAIEIVDKMDKQGMEVTSNVLLCLLSEAITRKNLAKGREIHRLTRNNNLESDTFLGTFFIRLYSTCGCLEEAIEAFGKVTNPSVYTWSAMIAAHAKLGKGEDGLIVYRRMLQESPYKPEENVLVAVLQACASIPSVIEGKEIHKYITDNNLGANVNIGSALIDMYTKCGTLEEASKVFERLSKRDLVVWNAMIMSFSHFHCIKEAIRLVQLLQHERLKPTDATFLPILEACGNAKDLEQGKLIHAQISQNNFDSNVPVINALVDMYAKCGSLEGMRTVFNKLRLRDGTNWKAYITGHVQLGECYKALEISAQMQHEAIYLSEAFVPLLKACSEVLAFDEVRRIHARALASLDPDLLVACSLIEMYCNCHKLEEAFRVFDKWPSKTVVTWGSIISGFAQHGHGQKALSFVKQMLQEGIKPTNEIFLSLLRVCSGNGDLELGKQIHALITDNRRESEIVLMKALIEMYERCGDKEEAIKVSETMLKV